MTGDKTPVSKSVGITLSARYVEDLKPFEAEFVKNRSDINRSDVFAAGMLLMSAGFLSEVTRFLKTEIGKEFFNLPQKAQRNILTELLSGDVPRSDIGKNILQQGPLLPDQPAVSVQEKVLSGAIERPEHEVTDTGGIEDESIPPKDGATTNKPATGAKTQSLRKIKIPSSAGSAAIS